MDYYLPRLRLFPFLARRRPPRSRSSRPGRLPPPPRLLNGAPAASAGSRGRDVTKTGVNRARAAGPIHKTETEAKREAGSDPPASRGVRTL